MLTYRRKLSHVQLLRDLWAQEIPKVFVMWGFIMGEEIKSFWILCGDRRRTQRNSTGVSDGYCRWGMMMTMMGKENQELFIAKRKC